METPADGSGEAMMARWLLSLLLTLLLAPPIGAQSPDEVDDRTGRRRRTIQRIDELLAQRYQEAGVMPASAATDSEFLRRACLDLTGVIPRVAEVRSFLADESKDKRQRLIERLLGSPRHATHLAHTWRQIMLPHSLDPQQQASAAGLESWLRSQFSKNMRFDRVVSDLLVAKGGTANDPALYFTALDLSPEKLAASSARIFLGQQIACAQCHNHPFDQWTQEDFWGYAAFFARVSRSDATLSPGQIRLVDSREGEVTLPESGTVVAPKYLGGRPVHEQVGGTRRVQLAIWMASRDNPYLARAAANRVWSLLFGRGLVEPVDDLGAHNPPSHPELLQVLTAYFVSTGFDLQELFRTLAGTAAYQRTSRAGDEDPLAPELFARMAVKTMTAEQLYDSLQRAVVRDKAKGPQQTCGGPPPPRLLFTSTMQMRGSNASEFEAGLLQALALLNGKETTEATSVKESRLLMALDAPFFSDEDRVETMFLATLSRLPRDEERTTLVEYVRDGGAKGGTRETLGTREALSDVAWALLNSAEFVLNH